MVMLLTADEMKTNAGTTIGVVATAAKSRSDGVLRPAILTPFRHVNQGAKA